MGFQTSKEKALCYSTYAYYLNRLGWEAGFEEKLTSYCMRRGTVNAVDGKYQSPFVIVFYKLIVISGAAMTAVRDQIMRHNLILIFLMHILMKRSDLMFSLLS
jgi:uncharacterized protein DUF3435